MRKTERKPPALASWMASKLLGNKYQEEFFGDLQEIYEQRIEQRGIFYARLMYWIDTIHLLAGFSTFKLFPNRSNVMFRTMFKIAWRNALRQKQFTALNILGLTLGIATCSVIGLYVYDEMTYDTFHVNGDRIYRINQPLIWGDWNEQFANTGPGIALALKEDVPEFEEVTRLMTEGAKTIKTSGEQESVREERFFAADPNFFRLFSFEFLQGDPQTCLNEAMSMVVTQETATRFFGTEDPMGKTIDVRKVDGTWDTYFVTAVIGNIPRQSHLQFNMLVSMNSYGEMMKIHEWKWIFTAFSTYGLVREGTDVSALTARIQTLPPKWAKSTTQKIFNQTFQEFTKGKPWTLYLQPLRQVYLAAQPSHHGFGPTGNPQYVKIFGTVGVLVLVLCSINFMNLSTARSTNRAKEVGVKKTMGSARGALVRQFIFESVLFVSVSTACALLTVQLLLPMFNAVADKQLELLPHFSNPAFIGTVLAFIIALGFLSGSYPAFYLSSFRPIETLKGKAAAGFKGKGLRNGLVILQFTISIGLVICTVFVQKQLSYTSSMDLGFAKDNILQIHNMEQLGSNAEVIRNRLSSNPAFTKIGWSHNLPPHVWEGDRFKADHPESPVVNLTTLRTEEDYVGVLGLQFLAGRNFDPAQVNDKYNVILNEEAVRALGLGTAENYVHDSPVGKYVVMASGEERKLRIIGVVKDFNFNSVRQKIDPLMIVHFQNDWFWNYHYGPLYLSMRLNPGHVNNSSALQEVIANVKNEVAKLDAAVPFEFSFMDKDFESTFRSESQMSAILKIFTVMALVIACLGLYGLAAFSAEQRMKELGIRKVLGARVSELVLLFSNEFTRLILLAILFAAPVAYFLVDTWLSGFAYRTPISPWVFLGAIAGALTIAILTISYQALSAARANPAETLKSE